MQPNVFVTKVTRKTPETNESLAMVAKGKASSLQETDESKPKKARHLSSDVWRYFSEVEIEGIAKARCNGCQGLFTRGVDKSTSHLSRHIKNCNRLDKLQDIGVMMLDT
ncbi:hypothetical protein QN277_009352 [Acacia crassicarpa]|uniref:BED-type domain-containing protein n=1 Tax=Acacia crassicarpa TaxID=499986 RepID=A0AAE1ISP3_9FABA|nr:hypothetical protein QN277_009352 [Acacia crassicarpa]